MAAVMTMLAEIVKLPPEAAGELAGPDEDLDPAQQVEFIGAVAEPAVRDMEAMAGLDDDPRQWADVTLPALLMYGDLSWEDPVQLSRRAVQDNVPNLTSVCLPGQSHFANEFAPHLIADAIRGYTADLDRS